MLNSSSKVSSAPSTPVRTQHVQRLVSTLGTENQLPRYFKHIVTTFANSGDFWHIMTTLPSKYTEKCKDLKLELAAYKEALRVTLFPSRQKGEKLYDDFSLEVENALFGDTGIYYTVTHRDNLETYTKHQAHCIIIEAETGVCINGASHITKGINLLSRISKIVGVFESLVNASEVLDHNALDLKDLAKDFHAYFTIQHQCLSDAISYHRTNFAINKAKVQDPNIKASDIIKANNSNKDPLDVVLSEISEIIEKWHNAKVCELTPVKHSTPCLEAIVGYSAQSNSRAEQIRELAQQELNKKRGRFMDCTAASAAAASTTTTALTNTTSSSASSPLLFNTSTGLTPKLKGLGVKSKEPAASLNTTRKFSGSKLKFE